MSAANVTDATFESEVLTSSDLVVVDFHATWCGPCQELSPVIDELSEEFAGQVKILKANVDEAPQAAAQAKVSAVPNVTLWKDGELVAQLPGVRPKETLAEAIRSALS